MFNRKLRSGLSSVIWWSVISAAFIGPGTVTTAAKAGSDYGLSLLWTLIFAIAACYILQESAARLSIISQKHLGENIACIFKNQVFKLAAGFSVVFGCVAYQAGNILGALEGLKMIWPGNRYFFILTIFFFCLAILINGQIKWLTRILGLMVATMGICFVIAIFKMDATSPIGWSEALRPQIPKGSPMLIVGLIGTTIVPYNLFLGSGLAKGKNISSMRTGLFTSVFIGGLITISILITGSFVSGAFDFPSLKNTIEHSSGIWVANLVGVGLFCAGLSSATTAPLAAAFTLQSLFHSDNPKWAIHGRYFRATWLIVLLTGLVFSLLDFKPIPVIIIAQILNGLILPFIALTLVLAINSSRCTKGYKNGSLNNMLLFLVILVCLLLGIRSLWSIF